MQWRRYILAGILTIAMLGLCALASAEAKAYGQFKLAGGGYVDLASTGNGGEQEFNRSLAAWGGYEGQPQFLKATVIRCDSKTGAMKRTVYIGEVLTRGDNEGEWHVDYARTEERDAKGVVVKGKRYYGVHEYFDVSRDKELTIRKASRKGHVVNPTGIKDNLAGRYAHEVEQGFMDKDMAIYTVELHANRSPEIVLQPWKHNYHYVGETVLSTAENEYYSKLMAKYGHSGYMGGCVLTAYEAERPLEVQTYFVPVGSRDIYVVNGDRSFLAFSYDK